MNKPNIETMLPSDAKKAMEDFFYNKLEALAIENGLGWYNLPIGRDHLHTEFSSKELGEWVTAAAIGCLQKAYDRFEQNYPICWSNTHQVAYRQGNGKLFFRRCDSFEKKLAIETELEEKTK